MFSRAAWWSGVSNALDELIIHGFSAREAAYELDVPLWIAVERFRLHHAQVLQPLAS